MPEGAPAGRDACAPRLRAAPARTEQTDDQERDAYVDEGPQSPDADADGDKGNGENQENHESVSHFRAWTSLLI